MKLLMAFILIWTTTSAFDLRGVEVPEGRIINGQTAVIGQFPYQVGIRIKHTGSTTAWCGAVLISQEWILTAAHCLENIIKVTVYLGTIVRHQSNVKYTVDGDSIIVHPEWSKISKLNDIALIRIPPTELSVAIQPIKLPGPADSIYDYAGEKVIVSGWGRSSDLSSQLPTYLQWGEMKVLANSVCRTRYEFFKSTNICIGPINGVSTCKGDSGGPLVSENRKVLVGLDSFGSDKGCQKGFPVVFTRITSYLEWIEAETAIS